MMVEAIHPALLNSALAASYNDLLIVSSSFPAISALMIAPPLLP